MTMHNVTVPSVTVRSGIGRRTILAGALAAPALAQARASTGSLGDLARRAAIYLFPVHEMYRLRWQATVDEANPLRQKLNRFRHVPAPADHGERAVTTPNADTLYSSAWLDLSLEPLFLTVPPVGDLYYSYAFLDLFTDTFAIVSHRVQGGRPPTQMIVGPTWKGDASSEVALIRAPTNSVWLLGRILLDGPEELDRLRILQSRVLLETPDQRNERRILEAGELMRFRTQAPAEPAADWPAPNPADPFDIFEVGMRALREGPLPDRDKPLFEELSPLKLKPGRRFDLRAFGEAERAAIRAGIEQGLAEIRAAATQAGQPIDGWIYGERNLGRFGTDYLTRAVTASTALGALPPAEAVYMSCTVDADDRPLSGAHRYELTFPAGGLPPAGAFWSLSLYESMPDGRAFFFDNPIGRNAIGDRTPGLARAADGSLTLYIQRQRPEESRAANWLPAPAGALRLVLRAYQPDEILIEGRYRMPAVRRNASP